MISLEIKYDHQGIRIGCEFRALWGEEGVQIHSVRKGRGTNYDNKGGKHVLLDYTQFVCNVIRNIAM
jgi:hypothetical protein